MSADPDLAALVMRLAGGPISSFGSRYPLSLAVDGDRLTQMGAPEDLDELTACLEAFSAIAIAMRAGAAELERFRQPPPLPWLGFYHRPTWSYLPRDDSLLAQVAHTADGAEHRTAHVVRGEMFPGCAFVALEHHWLTDTRSAGAADMVSDRVAHREVIHEIALPFSLPDFELAADSAWGRLVSGSAIDVEYEGFNTRFDVRSTSPKFAHDVLHPLQLEYLMEIYPQPFAIRGSRVRLQSKEHTERAIARELDVVAGFLARIPAFVWHDLGIAEPPLRLTSRGEVEAQTGPR